MCLIDGKENKEQKKKQISTQWITFMAENHRWKLSVGQQ